MLKKFFKKINRRGLGELIRDSCLLPSKLEYNPDTQELIDKRNGKVWGIVTSPTGHKYTHANQMGYEIMDSYNNRFNLPRNNIVTYIPDPVIPLEPNERANLESKVRGLKYQLEDAWRKLFRNSERKIKLNSELLRIEMEFKKGTQQDPKILMKMVRDYLNKYL